MANQSQKQPPQHQAKQPGEQSQMHPQPISIRDDYKGSEKLKNKVALISGGDSGIGRAIALHFAREGANIAIIYLEENTDAFETKKLIEKEDRECLLIPGDCRKQTFCQKAVDEVIATFKKLDILVNNAAEQHVQEDFTKISEEQLRKTFETNLFGYFFLTQAALPHLREGSVIINTGSITGFRGHKKLIDYSATKGAIQAFTFSLAESLAERKIRVNAVAPGPIWTPLIPASFSAEDTATFGESTLMKRAGQPAEVAPAYVYLASDIDSSFVTGQYLHVNGGALIAA